MQSLFDKLLFISKLNYLNENHVKFESFVNKLNLNYDVNKIDNNSMKMFKISVECNDFDVNEDKQRQCYKQFKCFWPKCRYSCYRKCQLNIHTLHHLNKRQFICEECDKQFNNNSHLYIHKSSVHSTDKTFVCNQINCNKTFKSKVLLTQHKRRHFSVKSFGCNKCDKRFQSNSQLNNHKNSVHSNVRPFVCPQSDCNKRFKRSNALYDHKIRFHTRIKRHKCFHNNCDKSFVTPGELKRHIRHKHSTEIPFKCDLRYCNFSCKSRGNLFNHKKTFHSLNN